MDTPSVVGKASLSLNVQQYNSKIGHYVVESIRRALHTAGKGGLRMRWSNSVVDLAHLPAFAMLPPLLFSILYERSPWVACSLKFSCLQCTASQLRAGRGFVSARLTNVLGLRCRVTLRLLSFSVPRSIQQE